MPGRGSKLAKGLLLLVWLAVVGGAVFLAVTRREEYGDYVIPIVFMAGFMLVLFVLTLRPAKRKGKDKQKEKSPGADRLGMVVTGLLIATVLLILVLHFVKTVRTTSLFGNGVILFFIVMMARILIDFIRDMRKPKRKRRTRKKKPAGETPAPEKEEAEPVTPDNESRADDETTPEG